MLRRLLPALLLLLTVVPLPSQDAKPFTMQRITFRGSRRLAQQQMLAIAQMKVGSAYSEQDLKNSANRLSNSGMFSQVSYRFSPTWAEFDVIDTATVVPLRFDNIPWLSDADLLAALEQRIPGFTGVVSEEGTLADDVGRQIEAILKEKGIKATVQNLPLQVMGQPVTAMSYSLLEPRVEIAGFAFTGAQPENAAALQQAIANSLGTDYARSLVAGIAEVKLNPVYQQRGYLHASFAPPSAKVISAPSAAVAQVEVTVPVTEGIQYRIAALRMKGDDAIAQDAAKQLAAFKTGSIANLPAFRAELSKLGGAYLAKGYMNAKVKAEPAFDDAAKTVSFDVELVPGDIYHLRALEIQGLDEQQMAKLRPLWKLNSGDVYDPTYAPAFLARNAQKLAFLNGAPLAWTQKIHDDEKQVDLFVFFRKPSSAH